MFILDNISKCRYLSVNNGLMCVNVFVLQGHVVHNWKARWFVLMPDKLLYYKYEGGKRESCQRGRIMLKECVVTCPFLEYDYRPVSQENVIIISWKSSLL